MKTEKDQIKVLMMFDSPTTMSGFSQVGNNVGKGFVARGAVVDVWGINFQGWHYHKVDWANQIFPGGSPGEWHMPDCLSRFLTVLQNGGYTHVWIMQDLFGFKVGEGGSNFAEEIFRICSSRGIRSCFYFPCDAPLDRDWVAVLGSVDAAVAYTEYGAMHARKQLARLESDQVVHVLPHGVDPVIYAPPADRATLRANLYRPAWFGPEDFVMINVNQHQRRKDVMRSLEILAELKNRGVPAKLIMHMANTSGELVTLTEWVPLRRGGREGVGEQLGLRYGKDWGHNDAVIPPKGVPLEQSELAKFYGAADLYLSTSLGEGWGLPAMEALATGTPIALPCHTACGEIMSRLYHFGMGDQCVSLPVEKGGMVLPGDNSRVRHRVDLDGAVDAIEAYYRSGLWKRRPVMNPEVRQWLNWDRIAGEFWRVLGLKEPVGIGEISPRLSGVGNAGVSGAAPTPGPGKERGGDVSGLSRVASENPSAIPALGEMDGRLAVTGEDNVPTFFDVPVPLLGVPILNRGDLLLRLFNSIDYPVKRMQVVWNGRADGTPDQSVAAALKEMEGVVDRGHFVKELVVLVSGSAGLLGNLGVAGSWNKLVDTTSDEPWWLISGNDMQLAPGDLRKIVEFVAMVGRTKKAEKVGMLYANAANLFVLTPDGRALGGWDENFFPAYLEDCDWARRCDLAGLLRVNIPDIGAVHGEPDAANFGKVTGSLTIRSDAALLQRNAVTHKNGFTYYFAKWGGSNGEETFTVPFQDKPHLAPYDRPWQIWPDLRAANLAAKPYTLPQ